MEWFFILSLIRKEIVKVKCTTFLLFRIALKYNKKSLRNVILKIKINYVNILCQNKINAK